MEVEWATLESIAQTGAIDMWLWFPICGVSRHLVRSSVPSEVWASRITRILGTEDWKQEWYPTQTMQTLFGEEERQVKDADFDKISQFVVKQLKTIFPGVLETPVLLRNSKNVPLFLFCFATSAQKESSRNAALRIAGQKHF